MTPKVFLGGTVNGSKWRDYIIPQLRIEYFNPVVAIWNDEAHEKEQYEKRTCDYCLYVLTPKLTGFYALAEIVHDCHSRPDKVIYCFLKDDQERFFTGAELRSLEELGSDMRSLPWDEIQQEDRVLQTFRFESSGNADGRLARDEGRPWTS